MLTPNLRPVLKGLAALAVLVCVGCGTDNPAGPGTTGTSGTGTTGGSGDGSELTGSWTLTSFMAGTLDAILAGSTMVMTFDEDAPAASVSRGVSGTFTLTVTNDALDLCDSGESDCSPFGTYEVTDGLLIFEPDSGDPLTWNYSVVGRTLTMESVMDGLDVVVTGSRL